MQNSRRAGGRSHKLLLRAVCETIFGVLLALPAVGASNCELPFHVPQGVLDQQLVILGEMHGTRETAEFTAEYSCTVAQGTVEVILALEIPEVEQQSISAYLGSLGSPVDAGALLKGDFWNRPDSIQDGRSSQAIFQLIERVRQLRGVGKRISVVAIDGQRTGLKRDGSMAQIVRDLLVTNPQTKVIALVGNLHALKDRGAFFNSDYESFGFLLSDLNPLTLNVSAKQGSAWVCVDRCGPRKLSPLPWLTTKDPGIYVGQVPFTPPQYHGTVVLERAEASPPARAQ